MSRRRKASSSMSHTKIARDLHLRKLRDEGFDLAISANHLLVHDMPCATSAKSIAYGTLAMPLNMVGDELGPPPDHTAKFIGECPCTADGKPLVIVTGGGSEDFGRGVIAFHQLSARPPERDKNYYDKVNRYEHTIDDQTRVIESNA